MTFQRFLITGGSGFIGSRMIPSLLGEGHEVTVLTRSPTKTARQFNQAVTTISQLDELADDTAFDVVINFTGQGIADRRWSDSVKQELRASRLEVTRDLITWLQRTLNKPSVFISGSAIGYYGLRGAEKLDESMSGDDSFSSQLCQDWEQQAQAAEALGIRTCYLRTGVVLGPDGGALSRMLLPFKLGLGGPIGDGKQWMSWVHIDDLIGIIRHIISHETVVGPVNGTAPEPVPNKTFAKTLGKVLNRPALLPMPAFMVKLLFGEMGEELLLSGQRVIPQKIINAGYNFQYPQLEAALSNVVA